IERRKHETVSLGQALSAIDRRKVDAQDQVNYDLFRRDVDDDLAAQRFPRELLAITQLAGPQYLSSTLDIMPARTARDYQDIVARSALPEGVDWYLERVRRETTTSLTPHEIHQLGLSEVKRIRGEMEKVLARVGFKGTLADFATFLRTDARFYFTDARELVRE